MPASAAVRATCSAILRAWASLSITQGPAIRNRGFAPPRRSEPTAISRVLSMRSIEDNTNPAPLARLLPAALVRFAVEDGVGEFLGGLGQGLLSRRDWFRGWLGPLFRIRFSWRFLLLPRPANDVVVYCPEG